ncbi:MAG: FAD-dependent oxidoreductase [Proteobacteria bacterium]|nr:FAD-dependent oxidoreductase [Pseudomonadota bacterium]
MTEQARVVVIGGGIMGTSLLYHLAHEGWTDCVLLEKGELTSGSTWHAAGQVTHSTSSFVLGKMAGYGIELYRRLEAETEQSVTWHGCGSLRVAYTGDEMDWLRHTTSVGRVLGHPMEIVGPARIRELHPFYNLDGIQAALHTPEDGHVDPAGTAFALAKGARMLGAKVHRQRRATGIEPQPGGEWLVRTEAGDIRCEHVVNAGGTYARQIGAWLGLDLPIVNMTHHYVVTDTVPEFLDLKTELPVVRDDRQVSGYIRMEQKSGLIGIYEKANPNTVWDDGTPWDSENELFEPDFDRIAPWLENALERMPVLAELGLKRAVHGAITHPPDGNMLLGPLPGLANAWACCGCQIGLGWGPGAGKYLAQWMVHGAADVNMREFDPRRFGAFADREYQIAKAREDYLLRHEIPFPGLNRPDGRPVKTSPLYGRLNEAGAVHEEIFGWERPRWYAGNGIAQRDVHSFRRAPWFGQVAEECRTVRGAAGLLDLSAFGKIDVAGPDAEAFLNRMVANRAPRKTGGIVLTHMLNRRGTIEAETTIARLDDDRFYLLFAAFHELRVRDHLVRHRRAGERVVIANVSEDFGCLVLSGPRSRDILGAITTAPLDNESFPWLRAKAIKAAGVKLRALRVSYVGELGWELHVPMAGMARVYDALWQAGKGHGIGNFGSHALNSMRLEKGFRGALELTNEVTLPEADVMRFVKMDKGEFIGREATQRSLDAPPRWLCAYLAIEAGDADCIGGDAVFADGAVVGSVSSGAFGHIVGKSLAFAYLKPECAAPGTRLEVQILDTRRPAIVLGEPAYDSDSAKPRS